MAAPTSRQELISYCLRQLGEPVIEINVDEDQCNDRLDEAIQFFREYHSEATKKVFVPHLVTQDNADNKQIDIDNKILFVERILPIALQGSSASMFDVKYQLHLNDVFALNNLGNLAYYEMIMQNLAMYDLKIGSGASELVRFVRNEHKLYLDVDKTDLVVGDYLMVEAVMVVDEENIYNDMFLKRYTTALIKKQWGSNLIKFEGMQLPGGVTLNGRQLFDDAVNEIKELEEQMRLTHELPVNFFVG